ncbi:hypothetical protein DES53_10396 [Roseimicrobium gellanilyticum]|uniref:Uncharacterized protein n=1 Tax=Roseimicrobium gellanilyticum TaxID=748857 RepID=A0A366HNL4_9BACT|nr:hypothetical protein [Roseimicrobium gellanilyticum]RBP45100.1 hypothetical protein DES53_10396 [Roseimicrobium gellanilyticum]
MKRRDWIAAAVGLGLGLTPLTSSAITGSEIAQMVLGCSVAAPLIVSLIATRYVMLLAFIPGVIMAISVNAMHAMMADHAPGVGAFLWGMVSFSSFLAAPAFIVSGTVKLVRYLRGSLEEAESS